MATKYQRKLLSTGVYPANEVQNARRKIARARKVAFTPEHPASQAAFDAWDELTESEKGEVHDAYNDLWDWLLSR